jgi:Glyoxalase-like domain
LELTGQASGNALHVLDHVFVLCAEGAPEAEALTQFGLREGAGNTHPGQGTTCRRFFFRNAYLELLWVHDVAEAQSFRSLPTRLFERWSSRGLGASPFGVVLRSAGPGAAEPPFSTWPYHPSYLPPDLAIDVAVGTLLSEPELFYFRPPRRPEDRASQPTAHAGPLDEVAAITIGVPGPSPRTPALRAVQQLGLASFPEAEDHGLILDFGLGPREKTTDLRPRLPLVLRF